MSSLDKSVNDMIRKMVSAGKSNGATAKGSLGEQAVFKICEHHYQKFGGILYHSFTYPVDKDKKGNIKKDVNGKLFVENLGSTTEIDVLLVTPFSIFPIEVKAYKAKKIILTDDGIEGVFKTDKSPVHQNEMHCRHLYPHLYKVLPNGESRYIKPIVTFVDECEVVDQRSQWQYEYIVVSILDTLREAIQKLDTPIDYQLNLPAIDRVLKNVCMSSEKRLPLRVVE